MARIRNKITGGTYQIPMKPSKGRLSEWSNDVRRLMILGRKGYASLKDVENLDDIKSILSKDPNTREQPLIDSYMEQLSIRKDEEQNPTTNLRHSDLPHNRDNKVLEDFVAIIDIDAGGYNKGYKTIKLPFIPRELNYDPQSNFVAIKPIGRNTSKYHYTGSEDILEFEIDWYAHDYARREVIENCRKIEALSKSDGYDGDPHRVMLMWGDGGVLFKDHIFIVLSAKYRLNTFNKGYLNKNNQIISTNMLPIQAYQTVRLGRISSYNLTKNAIEYVEYKPIARNSGITYEEPSKELRL